MGEAKRRKQLDPTYGHVSNRPTVKESRGISNTTEGGLEVKELGFLKIHESFSDRLEISGPLEVILAKAQECKIFETLTLSEHIWHRIVMAGKEESYLLELEFYFVIAATCMAVSARQYLLDENMFVGDLVTDLQDQCRRGSKDAKNLAVKLIHTPLAMLVSH